MGGEPANAAPGVGHRTHLLRSDFTLCADFTVSTSVPSSLRLSDAVSAGVELPHFEHLGRREECP